MTWIGLLCSLVGAASRCHCIQRCRIARHAGDDVHRRSARAGEEAGRRAIFDYVDRGSYERSDAARQPRRPGGARTAPARRHRRRPALDAHHHARAARCAMPVAIAPVGLTGLNWADGEILAARAAERFGVPFTLSTMSICSIEDVAGGVTQAVLVPALRDARPRLRRLAHRAREGGEVLGAGAHARPADPGPAPPGPEERARSAAAAHLGDRSWISCRSRAGR